MGQPDRDQAAFVSTPSFRTDSDLGVLPVKIRRTGRKFLLWSSIHKHLGICYPLRMPLRILGPLRPSRAEIREMVDLAIPVAVVQVGIMAMGAVDAIMVGRVSAVDLAAVALGNVYYFSTVVFGMGVLFSLDPLVSQAVGAHDEEAISRAIQRSGLLGLGLTVLAALVLLLGAPILTVLRQPPEVVTVAAPYAKALIPGILPFYLFISFRQTLQAMGYLRPIVIVILAANVANFFFNWLFIFGNMGFPEMGAVGSGWASALARTLMMFALIGLAWPLLAPYVRPLRPGVFASAPILKMLRVGTPIGVQLFLEFGAFGVTGILMGWLGAEALAGHQIALTLAATTFMLAVGVSQASAVLVGRSVGREDTPAARRAAGAGIALVVAVMCVTALIFLVFPQMLSRMFSNDLTVIGVAAVLLPVAGVFQVFDGLQAVASGILRGAGETRAPMVINVLGFWLIGMPAALYLAFVRDWGPIGLWWGLAIGLGAVSFFLLIKIRSHFRNTLSRLIVD